MKKKIWIPILIAVVLAIGVLAFVLCGNKDEKKPDANQSQGGLEVVEDNEENENDVDASDSWGDTQSTESTPSNNTENKTEDKKDNQTENKPNSSEQNGGVTSEGVLDEEREYGTIF